LSGDAKNDHVSDALAEELISALMHIPGIRITSRTSAFQFRGAVNLNRIRSEVHADLAIEGSVQQAGKKLRLTVRLVNVADGYSLWSARYEGETADVFRLHDEIAGCVAKALRTVLTEARHLSERRDGVNMDAFELCLRARHNWHQRTPENLQTSIAQFETAIRLDPHCALGYAGLADSYSILAFYGYLPREDARIAANRAAKRALQLGPEFAESHYARALYTMWLASEWPQAERSFRKALEIQPDFAPAHTHYSALLAVRQRYAEARDHLAEASAVDPLSPAVYGTGALCMFTSLQYGEAERFGKRALELYPNFAVALYALGLTYCRTKRFDRACDAFERLLSLSNGAPYFQAWAAMAHASAGNRNTALALATEMANKHPSQSIHPLTHVLIGIALNDPGAAADALGAYTAQDGSGFQLGHILPFFTRRMLNSDMLRQLKRMHLEPAAGIESRPIARIR
jgi:TolB-like protein/Tfp pilus assembly protein PilF